MELRQGRPAKELLLPVGGLFGFIKFQVVVFPEELFEIPHVRVRSQFGIFILCQDVLIRGEDIIFPVGGEGFQLGIAVVGNHNLPGHRLAGGDNDHAVGSLCPVYGCGSGIFQYVDAGDVGGGNGGDAADDESVNDIKGGVVLGDGSAPADADDDFGIGGAVSGLHVDPWHTALQSVSGAGHRDLLEFLPGNGRNGSREIGPLGLPVTYSDNLIELGGFGFQRNRNCAPARQRDFLGGIPDKGNHQGGIDGRYIEGEIPVSIGYRSRGGPLYYHVGPGDPLPVGGVGHISPDGDRLRKCNRRNQEKSGRQQNR